MENSNKRQRPDTYQIHVYHLYTRIDVDLESVRQMLGTKGIRIILHNIHTGERAEQLHHHFLLVGPRYIFTNFSKYFKLQLECAYQVKPVKSTGHLHELIQYIEPDISEDDVTKIAKDTMEEYELIFKPGYPIKCDLQKTLTEQLIDLLIEKKIGNQTDFNALPVDDIKPFLKLTNLNSIFSSVSRVINQSLSSTSITFYPEYDDAEAIENVATFFDNPISKFLMNTLQSEKTARFLGKALMIVINKKENKKNTIWIHGPSNSGKTLFLKSFLENYLPKLYGLPNNDKRSSFPFNNCIGRRAIFWDEPEVHPENIENVKLLLGGQDLNVEIKYQSSQTLQRTPVFIASNKIPGHNYSDKTVFTNRCFIFKFNNLVPQDTPEFTLQHWQKFLFGCNVLH